MTLIHYLERSQFIGSRESYCCGVSIAGQSHSGYWPHTAYFCPICGEIWAREVYQHGEDYTPIPQSPWVVESRRCVSHGDGTLLTGIPLGDCSPELLQRELNALLVNAERNT